MTDGLVLRRTQLQNAMEVWQIDVGKFPLSQERRPALADFLQNLQQQAAARYHLTETVWFEATHLHLDGASKLIALHAREWVPKTGFGVSPDGEPPRLWTSEDFSDAAFGTKLPIFNNQVFEVSRAAGHASAIATMAGRGVLSSVLLSGTADAYKQSIQPTLGSLVQERAFHAYAFFFPLLTAASASDARIAQWMGKAAVYVREVFDEQQVHILSTVPLGPCLQAIGVEMQTVDLWEVVAGV